MLANNINERHLIGCLLEALRRLPQTDANLVFSQSATGLDDFRHDAEVSLLVAEQSFTLLIEVKKTVYPRDVHQLAWRFRDAQRNSLPGQNKKSLLFLVAESISPGARETLEKECIGYYDSGGSLYLPAPGAYFYIDKPPPKAFTKSMRSMFSGRRAQVLHAMLIQHQNWFSVKELAQQANVSPATVSQVLTEIERFEWVESRGQGPSKERHLFDPAALLDAWAKQFVSMRLPNLHRYFVPSVKSDMLPEHMEKIFDARNVQYAISNEAAAQRYSPFLSNISQVRIRVLTAPNADAAVGDLDARPVTEGANLIVIETKSPDELLFRERVDGVWLASPIQVYLDLLRGEGRSKEMAEHLRKERIGF